jgi:hypothetical protein
MTESTKNKIENYLNTFSIGNWSILDYYAPGEYDSIDFDDAYNSIMDYLEKCGGLDYVDLFLDSDQAIDFLRDFDSDLTCSLKLAAQKGLKIEDLNICILASILEMDIIKEDLADESDNINKFFKNLKEY